MAAGGAGVKVAVGGCGADVLVGRGTDVLVGGAAAGVSVAAGVDVAVGGTGVCVAVGVELGVGVQLGVKVKVGRGVLVGSGVGVGTRTSNVPTEQPRLLTRTAKSSKPGSDLSLIIRSGLLFRKYDPVPNPLVLVGAVGERHHRRNLGAGFVHNVNIPGTVNKRAWLKFYVAELNGPAFAGTNAPCTITRFDRLSM